MALTLWGDTRPPDWHTRAACRGRAPLWWDGADDNAGTAQRICHTCPVWRECRSDAEWYETAAQDTAVIIGITGGDTASQRARRYAAHRYGIRSG